MNTCSYCKVCACCEGQRDKLPKGCPSFSPGVDAVEENYGDAGTKHFMRQASLVEKEGYGVATRVEEVLNLILKMQYKEVGFAFCIGLKKEMEIINKIYSGNGFNIHAVGCKCGMISKDILGPRDEYWISSCGYKNSGYEGMCNPVGQAAYLNACKTEFNVVLGLCVGHDTLFIKHSTAPMTILAVKDRVTGHSPLTPVYLTDSYYNRLLTRPKAAPAAQQDEATEE